MKTITLKNAEYELIRKLAQYSMVVNKREASFCMSMNSEKKMLLKRSAEAKALLKTLDAF